MLDVFSIRFSMTTGELLDVEWWSAHAIERGKLDVAAEKRERLSDRQRKIGQEVRR